MESFEPGYLASLGLDYAALAQENPRLIMISITPFGQTGPYSAYQSEEIVTYALSGIMSISGMAGREPLKHGGMQSQYEGGLSGTVGVLAALHVRDMLGEGQHVDVSLQDVVTSTLVVHQPMYGWVGAVQIIDVRDLAAFMLRAIDHGCSGAFNLTSPPHTVTMGALLQACAEAADCRPQWVWAAAAELERLGLAAWSDLPVWLPAAGEHAAFALADTRAAEAAGLQIRPLAQTVADTLAWYRRLPAEQQAFSKAGLSPEREAAALAGLLRR